MGASSQAYYLCRQLIKEKKGIVNMIIKLRRNASEGVKKLVFC